MTKQIFRWIFQTFYFEIFHRKYNLGIIYECYRIFVVKSKKNFSNCIIIFMLYIVNISQELGDLKSSNLKSFRDIQVDESNILSWTGLIIPVSDIK